MLKFSVTIKDGQMVMDADTKARWTKATRKSKDGFYDVLLRPQLEWDVTQMRKYLHGPVLKFLAEQFKSAGYMYSKDQIKEYLKYDWGPRTELVKEEDGRRFHRNGPQIPKSTAEYDFATYTKFLNDINAWCIEAFQCELPPAEQIE